MRSADFVAPYSRELTPAQIYRTDFSETLNEAQRRSYLWGQCLHDVLSGSPPEAQCGREGLIDYLHWAHAHTQLVHDVLGVGRGLEPLNEISFHGLNRHMALLWLPLFEGGWTEAERRRRLIVCQNSLALEGLTYYNIREKLVEGNEGTEAFFEPQAKQDYGCFTGIIQEYDAAIVLIDVIRKHPELTVIPAPMQFECVDPRRNVDFLVIDFIGQRAVGIQVKTNVRNEHVTKYDPARVVLIDGTVDLGNVKVMRIKKGSSIEVPRPWPGIIAAKRVDDIKTAGKHTFVEKRLLKYLLRRKHLARSLVGGITVDYREISAKISKRILGKL